MQTKENMQNMHAFIIVQIKINSTKNKNSELQMQTGIRDLFRHLVTDNILIYQYMIY